MLARFSYSRTFTVHLGTSVHRIVYILKRLQSDGVMFYSEISAQSYLEIPKQQPS